MSDTTTAPPPAAAAPTAPAAPAAPSGGNTILTGGPAPAASGDPSPAPDWRASLPETFRTTPSLQPFTSFESQAELIEALGKSYVETKGLVGKKLEAPGEGATPEQIANWRKTVGAPDTPEGYGENLRPESFPEDQWNAETEKEFRQIAHKHHLTPAAVKEILGVYEKSVLSTVEIGEAQFKEHLAAEVGTLKKAWGGEYERNLSLAQRFAATIGLKSDDPIFTQASVVEAMARGAALLSESKLVNGQAVGLPATNRERAMAIMDPKNGDTLAREYRGEFGPERQAQAQSTLNHLLGAR